MRRSVLLLLLMLSVAEARAVAPIDGFRLNYRVLRNGSPLGNGMMRFQSVQDGVWQFDSAVTGTSGLIGVAGAGVSERSTLIAPKGGLELFGNRLETKVAWKTDIKSTALQKGGKSYSYRDSKGLKQIPYRPGLLDQHSLTLALISDLRAGNGPVFRYSALAKGRIVDYTFKRVGEQSLDTALGKLETVRVDRIRESSDGKSTRIWFAKTRGYLPVLTQELDAKGENIEMRILAIK